MKHLYLSVVLVILGISFGNAQPKKTDREEAGLLGMVKSVKETSTDYTGEKITGSGFMKREGDLVSYDQAGHEIERRPVSDFGEAMGRMSRNYDQQGFLTESSWIDGKGKLIKKDVFIYSDGKLSETLTYNGDGVLVEKTVRDYDSKGRLGAEIYYDPNKPAAKTVFEYDSGNNPIEMAFFMADGRKATAPVGPCLGAHRVTVVYNEKGQSIARAIFEDNGTQKKSFRWKYDDRGRVVEYYSESQGSTVTFVYKYEFDTKGNWIKQIATGTSLEKGLTVFGKPPTPYVRSTVTIREIAYF